MASAVPSSQVEVPAAFEKVKNDAPPIAPKVRLPGDWEEEADKDRPQSHVFDKYREIMATFPKGKGWKEGNDLYFYQDFWYYAFFLERIMNIQENFKAQPNDIFIVSTPKTGTTWLKALTYSIVNRNRFDDTTNPLLRKVPHDCVPFLEADLGEYPSKRDPNNPIVATHIPYTSLPESILNSNCKIIYIWRDAKDAFASRWHFFHKMEMLFKSGQTIPLEEAFDLWCQGTATYGPYWNHISGYWKASQEFPEKILFLKYDDVKADTAAYVKKMATFMGYPFTPEEEENGAIQKIANMCSFENLSNLDVNKNGERVHGFNVKVQNNFYFRKGKVGDWENLLTPEMGARLDKVMDEKLGAAGVPK